MWREVEQFYSLANRFMMAPDRDEKANRYQTKLRIALQVMVNHRGQILVANSISILLVTVIAVVEVMTIYSHYAAIIDARLADRSLLYPAGIYAAPCRVSLGERITSDALVERLLRAGYQESERSNEFAAGSFTLQPDSLELRTNNSRWARACLS